MIGVCVVEGSGACRKSKNRVRLREKNVANWAWEEGMPYPLPYISRIFHRMYQPQPTLSISLLGPGVERGGRGDKYVSVSPL